MTQMRRPEMTNCLRFSDFDDDVMRIQAFPNGEDPDPEDAPSEIEGTRSDADRLVDAFVQTRSQLPMMT